MLDLIDNTDPIDDTSLPLDPCQLMHFPTPVLPSCAARLRIRLPRLAHCLLPIAHCLLRIAPASRSTTALDNQRQHRYIRRIYAGNTPGLA